ncbi:hypothetical protein J8J20_24710 [Mycobacterium tuberculosis]|nr:hypothetical protein [Mycobacterium tuberculosis]
MTREQIEMAGRIASASEVLAREAERSDLSLVVYLLRMAELAAKQAAHSATRNPQVSA